MPEQFTQRLHLGLVVTAVVAVQLAINGGYPGPWWQWLEVGLVVVLAWLCVDWWKAERPIHDLRVVALLLGVFAGHFLLEQAVYSVVPRSAQLLDGQITLAMRNLMLAAFLFRRDPRVSNMTLLLSLALISTSVFVSVYWSVTICGIVYAILGVAWLVTSHWDRLAGHFPEGTQVEVPRGAVSGAFALAILLAAIAIYFVGTNHDTRALAGFMPSSGGNQISDVRAQGGVGDGDDLVRGTKDAMSFGPTESEIFLESRMPSLFDVFDDTYDVPVKKKKSTQKAVSLPPSRLEHRHSRISTSKSKGNDFSLLRRNGGRRQQGLDDKKSAALFYVKGRVPLHLRTTIYDGFDGISLHEATSHAGPPLRLVTTHDVPWFETSFPVTESLIHSQEEHLLKFINLKTDRIPAPPRLVRFHVKDVDRADMFGIAADGHPRITIDFIPQLTVMRVQSLLVSPESLRSDEASAYFHESLAPPDDQAHSFPQIRNLAQEWTQGLPSGWQQIDAVVERLRSDYAVSDTSDLPEDTDFPVEGFLLDTRQGPDYLFATAASLLLRELGYTTRVVSGFYAHPRHYDSATQQTAVYGSDVHFWVEVSWDGQSWHPVEPTPGYELLEPPLSLWGHFRAACVALFDWCQMHWLQLAMAGTLLVIGFALRRHLLNAALDLANQAFWIRCHRARVLWTLRLLEWQAWLWGARRPLGLPPSQWVSAQCAATAERAVIDQFSSAVNWALYAPTRPCPVSASALAYICRHTYRAAKRASHPIQTDSQTGMIL